MSLQTIVFDCARATVSTIGGEAIPLLSVQLGTRRYHVEYQGAVICPCELPGCGEEAVREVVGLCNVKWREQRGDPNAR